MPTPFYGAAELGQMVAEFGVPVTAGGVTVKGIVDVEDQGLLKGEEGAAMVGRDITVTVKSGALPGLAAGATVVVDGTTYLADAPHTFDDGALTRFRCTLP